MSRYSAYYRPIDIVKMTRGLPRTGEPREKFTYPNTNYTLIGVIIDMVAGHTLAGELDRRLFRRRQPPATPLLHCRGSTRVRSRGCRGCGARVP